MKDFCQVGCVSVLAFVFGGATALAQVGGAPPAGAQARGGLQDNSSALDDAAAEARAPIAKKIPPPAPARMSTFNRVTTTRKQVAPAPAAGASRAGTASSAAVAAARAKAINSAIPAGSTWRQAQRPAPPPATTVKSVTRSYYPGMRPGVHPNADVAQTRARTGRGSTPAGMGMGALSGGRAKAAARPGLSGTAGHGHAPGAGPPRR